MSEARPEVRRRRSMRLKGYDYAQAGMYFVTACTHERACSFGAITDSKMRPSEAGSIVQATWNALPEHYPHVALDSFVLMPNHMHGIIVIMRRDDINHRRGGFQTRPYTAEEHLVPTPQGLPEIVRAFKTFSSRRINQACGTLGAKVWQRNYWERIIRDDEELAGIREYIQNNPARWDLDKLHPQSEWSLRMA